MNVKTILAHSNAFGDSYEKKKGDVYELPDGHADVLIEGGMVEKHEPAPPAKTKE